jgi:hypothetical protein
MTERFHELARRSRIAAMVLGRGNAFELFYLHENNSEDSIQEAARRGFRAMGIVGMLPDGRVQTEAQEGEEAASIMASATSDFRHALARMHAHAPVN